jgi:hypothetical protein
MPWLAWRPACHTPGPLAHLTGRAPASFQIPVFRDSHGSTWLGYVHTSGFPLFMPFEFYYAFTLSQESGVTRLVFTYLHLCSIVPKGEVGREATCIREPIGRL